MTESGPENATILVDGWRNPLVDADRMIGRTLEGAQIAALMRSGIRASAGSYPRRSR